MRLYPIPVDTKLSFSFFSSHQFTLCNCIILGDNSRFHSPEYRSVSNTTRTLNCKCHILYSLPWKKLASLFSVLYIVCISYIGSFRHGAVLLGSDSLTENDKQYNTKFCRKTVRRIIMKSIFVPRSDAVAMSDISGNKTPGFMVKS